jgi:tryptophan synthase alpha chain
VALIPYLTAGFPSRDQSLAALHMLDEAGADIIELGIPFSDPVADGPVIQRSTQVALEGGMTVRGTLELVREAQLRVPVVAFGYLNPLLAYGLPRFLEDARAAGVAGLLLTDLPGGMDPAVESTVRASDLALIPLVAPTTSDMRLRGIAATAEGFIYLISRLGVTGAATTLDAGVADAVARVHRVTSLPVAIGFGIRAADQARIAARHADGVVVGSALVERLQCGLQDARDLVAELRTAIDDEARSRAF